MRLVIEAKSSSLQLTTSLVVLLPQEGDDTSWGAPPIGPDGPPVLYLLHGLSDDAAAWTRFTSIERYAARAGLAVVMPEVGRSMYADEYGGSAWFTWVTEELPDLVARTFRVSTHPEDTYLAGLSMGGYGAIKAALHHPERYAAAASLSGVLDIAAIENSEHFTPAQLHTLFGPNGTAVGTTDDLLHLLREADPATVPALYLSCGTEDELYGTNLTFQNAALEVGLTPTVEHRPGAHTWEYWDPGIARVIDWLPQRAVTRSASRPSVASIART